MQTLHKVKKKLNEKNEVFKGKINKKYKSKVLLKTNFGLLALFGSILVIYLLFVFLESQLILLWIIFIITTVILPYIIINVATNWYLNRYIDYFSYHFAKDKIVITHGVLTKIKATIPYSRIQNINIVNGVFDRMYDIYTVKVETAGSSAAAQAAQSGVARPEGYIPGLKNPEIVEKKINEMITEYAGIPSGLEDKVFKPEELAFDNFISYILSKMREGDLLKTSISELRIERGMTIAEVAGKVGVPAHTIEYLEEGRYSPSLLLAYKIAEALNCRIEDLFKVS
ncbi:MAG: helix-turn-helix domain-containing protein [Promethearchaeota archaeon]|nr:MAG: helix-turn-helix domain-containing protein [Candidatus Lokiarchaeota archaeon]